MISRLAYKLAFLTIAAGVVGIGSIASGMQEDREFTRFARTALAEPATAAVPGTPYQGSLEYQTADGATVLIPPSQVPLEVRDRIAYLKSVEIQYVPGKTDTVRYTQWPNKQYGVGSLLFAILLFGAGCGAMYLLRKQRD